MFVLTLVTLWGQVYAIKPGGPWSFVGSDCSGDDIARCDGSHYSIEPCPQGGCASGQKKVCVSFGFWTHATKCECH